MISKVILKKVSKVILKSKEENIEHVLITTGIPRSNGQVERVNRTLIPLLSKLTDPERGDWYKYLGLAQQCINMCLVAR
jgi:hypothetical protein